MEDTTVRVTIRVSRKVKDYFEGRSLETGVAQSALMLLAMEEYIDQKKAIDSTPSLLNGVTDIKELLSALSKGVDMNMDWDENNKPCDVIVSTSEGNYTKDTLQDI